MLNESTLQVGFEFANLKFALLEVILPWANHLSSVFRPNPWQKSSWSEMVSKFNRMASNDSYKYYFTINLV